MSSIAVYNFNDALENAAVGVGNVRDDTGNYHGDVVAASVSIVDGPIGEKSRVFTGGGVNRISIPHNSVFNFFGNNRTVELWAKYTALTSTWTLTKYNTARTNGPFDFYVTSNKVRVRMTDNILTKAIFGPTVVLDTWYYMAMTYNGTSHAMKFYVNGALWGVDTQAMTAAMDTTDPIVGSQTANGFYGELGGIRISDTEKSYKEIYDYYMGSNVKEGVT